MSVPMLYLPSCGGMVPKDFARCNVNGGLVDQTRPVEFRILGNAIPRSCYQAYQ